MTTALLVIGLAFVAALLATWLVAHRAAKAGALATSEHVWESCTTFLLIVPSLVEQAIDEGRTWLRNPRSRVLGSHQSLSWLIIGSLLGSLAWGGIAFLAATMDVEAFRILEFSNPLGLGLAVAVANSVAGSLFADIAGWTKAWPFPPVAGRARVTLLSVIGLVFVVLLGLQGALGAVRADNDLTVAAVKIDQRAAIADAAAAGVETPDERQARLAQVQVERDRLEGRRSEQVTLATAVPVLVGLLEAALAIALLYGLRLLIAIPAVVGGAALWLLRLPVFLMRQAVSYGLRLVMDLFAAVHGIAPRPADHPPVDDEIGEGPEPDESEPSFETTSTGATPDPLWNPI